jgi:hypothetical protein
LKLTVQIKWLKDTGVKPSPIWIICSTQYIHNEKYSHVLTCVQ